jgi:asparagine synthase (glutamine-hydrolysing)
MILAVSHSAGADRASSTFARAAGPLGDPASLARTTHAVAAGWRHSHAPTSRPDVVVEGRLETRLPEHGDLFASTLVGATGDFALLAIESDTLVVASGPAGGHRPIFVARTHDGWIASTRLRALVRGMGRKPTLDVDFLAASLVVDYPLDSTATPYVGVFHVPMGEAWRLRPGKPPERREILAPFPREERTDRSAWPALLRDALSRAAQRSAAGARRVGVTLSGGLDSSTLLLTLEDLRRRGAIDASIDAFSWDFDTPDPNDDRPFRRCIEEALGNRSTPVSPDEAGPFAQRALVLDAAPCTDTPCLLWLALDAAASRQGIERMVTGLGGDNVLDCDPRLLASEARRGPWLRSLRTAIALKGFGGMPWWQKAYRFVLRPQARGWAPDQLRAVRRRRSYRRTFPWIGPRLESWLERRIEAQHRVVTLTSTPAERYEALVRMPFLNDMTLIRSQQEEVTACRRAEPLFDDDLLRFVASLPPLALLAGGFARGLLREAMAGVVPEKVRLRPWKAYMDPAIVRAVGAAGGFAAFEHLKSASRAADLGLIDPVRYRARFERLARDPTQLIWWSVWPVIAVEEFLRQYDRGEFD